MAGPNQAGLKKAAKRRKQDAARGQAPDEGDLLENLEPQDLGGKFLSLDGDDVEAREPKKRERRKAERERRKEGKEVKEEEEEDPLPEAPSSKKGKKDKGWKAVQMEMEVLKEFEAEGGLFIEEADDEEIMGITYGDGRTETINGKEAKEGVKEAPEKKSKLALKQARKRERKLAEWKAEKQAAKEAKDPDRLAAENERLRQKLRELGGEAAVEEETPAEAKKEEVEAVDPQSVPVEELSAWVEYDLHPSLMKGLARRGFRQPSAVQARCLTPAIRQRKDICGAAETGSGKTLAFGLPILHHTLTQLDSEPSNPSAEPKFRKGELRALVILPTRELAVQVQGHLNAVARGTPVFTECVVGGMSILKQKRLLARQPYIVVGTPGRVWALLGLGKDAESERCDWLRSSMSGLRHLVLDEADRLVESGHFKELDAILGFVYGALERGGSQLQTFVFSATLTLDPRSDYHRKKDGDEGGKIAALMRRLKFREARSVHLVDLTQEEAPAIMSCAPKGGKPEVAAPVQGASRGRLPERLTLQEARCSDDKDREALLAMWLLRRYRWNTAKTQGQVVAGVPGVHMGETEKPADGSTGGRVVVFVNAITSVMRLNSVLSLLMEAPSASKVLNKVKMSQSKGQGAPPIEVEVVGLHSRMRQKDRMKRMERFRSCKNAVLVCTDIAARGLDVPDLAAVVHYQVPRGGEIFIHRSGRTARAGRSGESVSIMGPGDAQKWGNLYRAVGVDPDALENVGPSGEELNAAREAARLCADLEGRVHKLGKQSADRSWLKRTADEAELMISDDEVDADAAKAAAPKNQLWGLYQQLQERVRRPPRRIGGTNSRQGGGGGGRGGKRKKQGGGRHGR